MNDKTMKIHYDRKKNFEERLKFLHLYIDWIQKTPNKIWSKQQADFLDSLYENGKNYSLSTEDYLNMVDAGKKVRNKRLDNRKIF